MSSKQNRFVFPRQGGHPAFAKMNVTELLEVDSNWRAPTAYHHFALSRTAGPSGFSGFIVRIISGNFDERAGSAARTDGSQMYVPSSRSTHGIAIVLGSIQFYVCQVRKPALLLFLSMSARMSPCRQFLSAARFLLSNVSHLT
jgi:hypothetical protein